MFLIDVGKCFKLIKFRFYYSYDASLFLYVRDIDSLIFGHKKCMSFDE